MNNTILLVDDDIRVVSALQRSLYRDYQIEIAAGPSDALNAFAQNSYAVIVSDLQMPGMNGIELLRTLKESYPETVRVLLTGQANLDAAIDAVNDGNVFRFLTKPCPHELLRRTLDAALEQHSLELSEKDVLRETLMGTVGVLADVLSAVQPMTFGRASRIRGYVARLAAELHLPIRWEFEAAAMLSQIGCISVDPAVLKKHCAGEALSPDEFSHLMSQAVVGEKLLQNVPRLHLVSCIVGRQYQPFEDRSELDPSQYNISIGAQMLRVAVDFDRFTATGLSPEDAIAEMRLCGSEYCPEVFNALQRVHSDLVFGAEFGEVGPSEAQAQLFRPIAAQVLRSLRQ